MEYAMMIVAAFFIGATVGLIIGESLSEVNEEKAKIEVTEEEKPPEIKNKVTKTENPTFMEQVINIMNFNGENQKEGKYENSEGTDGAEYMG